MLAIYFGALIVALVFAGLIAGLSDTGRKAAVLSRWAQFLLISGADPGGLIFVMLLPLVFLTTRWFVAPVVILTERCGPVSALRRSWRLTEGSFWRLFGLLILMAVLNSVVLSLPLSLIQFFAVILLTSQMLGAVNGVLTGLGYLVSILWYPFLALTLVLVYYDLRVRKENLDLDMRIRALEMAVRPPTLPAP
jgi:membrane-anchored glycerophosphoryl diester phosphodiesterase (GDPDase)